MLTNREYKGLEDIKRAFSLDDEMAEKLNIYVNMLKDWTKHINLIGPNTVPNIWERHIADSLQLKNLISKDAKVLIDFGSGAGLPGIILAMVTPLEQIHLVESNGSKSAFLREAARKTELKNVKIHNCRIESVPAFKTDIITARALASLDKLCEYIEGFYGDNTVALLPKGQNAEKETIEAKKHWNLEYKTHKSITNEDALIYEITDLNKKASK